jgi:hypothetical protein
MKRFAPRGDDGARMTRLRPSIAVTGPRIPAELIRAHGFEPVTVTPLTALRQRPQTAGVCAVAHGWVEALTTAGPRLAAAVLTTRCDQLRRAAETARERIRLPVFVMNIPVTHGTEAACHLYREEAVRLDGFLSRLAGEARAEPAPARGDTGGVPADQGLYAPAAQAAERALQGGHRVGLLGCCLTEADYAVVQMLGQLGLQLVANATESPLAVGTPPRRRPRTARGAVPTAAASGPFVARPAIAQRPNAPFFAWLRQFGLTHRIEGWVLLRQPWCDLYHAEVPRLKSETELPWLDLETGAQPAFEALRTRAEAFAERLGTLRGGADA